MKEGRRVILCVDDDLDLLAALRIRLQEAGYEVQTAASAEEGLQRWRAEPADLVVLDLMMEEIDSGMGFIKDLKLAGSSAPILLLSGVGHELAVSANARDLGLAAVFQKPVDFAALLGTIRSTIG